MVKKFFRGVLIDSNAFVNLSLFPIDVSTTHISATGSDYIQLYNYLVSFVPGKNNAVITLIIQNDNLVEETETFAVSVRADLFTKEQGESSISIIDDDGK